MINKTFKKHLYLSLAGFGAIAFSIIFFFCIFRASNFFGAINVFMAILMPFVYGAVIAYLLAPLCGKFEKYFCPIFIDKMKNKKRANSLAKGISVALSMVIGLLVIVGVCYLIVPQVALSISAIVAGSPEAFRRTYLWIEDFFNNNEQIRTYFNQITQESIDTFLVWLKTDFVGSFRAAFEGVSSGVLGVAGFFKNLLIGSIVAVYLLSGRQKFCAQAKKINYALFNVKSGNIVLEEVRFANTAFGGFIRGKLLDSLIIGIMCFVFMAVLKWPYPVLIGVIIGITNIIPFFGPFIGAIPATLIIFTVSPIQSLYFLVFILMLQQFDGNILGPKILGGSTGLSSFWVLFSILLFGGLFGVVGMIVGVPIFAVIYRLVSKYMCFLLRKKDLPENTVAYMDLDKLEGPVANTGEVVK